MTAIFYTSNPKDVYEFEWIIENFSLVPKVIRSPQFTPLPNSHAKWFIELKMVDGFFPSDGLFITAFLEMSEREFTQYTINSVFHFYSIADRCIACDTSFHPVYSSYANMRYALNVKIYIPKSDWAYLPEDTLKVKGKLTIAGHKINSIINTLRALPAPPVE
ncbi:hypothetical protein AVEN_247364-1 [Araneus ventricosus]|uniref:MATH domain-containing protein n=1 Tax=Araneus ventricosus TaxID=182803 RepID=A0A4Y2U3H9_ARAVE|nr:hypothetical protein AVEN_247364-1 [Araneus ventricosus]